MPSSRGHRRVPSLPTHSSTNHAQLNKNISSQNETFNGRTGGEFKVTSTESRSKNKGYFNFPMVSLKQAVENNIQKQLSNRLTQRIVGHLTKVKEVAPGTNNRIQAREEVLEWKAFDRLESAKKNLGVGLEATHTEFAKGDNLLSRNIASTIYKERDNSQHFEQAAKDDRLHQGKKSTQNSRRGTLIQGSDITISKQSDEILDYGQVMTQLGIPLEVIVVINGLSTPVKLSGINLQNLIWDISCKLKKFRKYNGHNNEKVHTLLCEHISKTNIIWDCLHTTDYDMFQISSPEEAMVYLLQYLCREYKIHGGDRVLFRSRKIVDLLALEHRSGQAASVDVLKKIDKIRLEHPMLSQLARCREEPEMLLSSPQNDQTPSNFQMRNEKQVTLSRSNSNSVQGVARSLAPSLATIIECAMSKEKKLQPSPTVDSLAMTNSFAQFIKGKLNKDDEATKGKISKDTAAGAGVGSDVIFVSEGIRQRLRRFNSKIIKSPKALVRFLSPDIVLLPQESIDLLTVQQVLDTLLDELKVKNRQTLLAKFTATEMRLTECKQSIGNKLLSSFPTRVMPVPGIGYSPVKQIAKKREDIKTTLLKVDSERKDLGLKGSEKIRVNRLYDPETDLLLTRGLNFSGI